MIQKRLRSAQAPKASVAKKGSPESQLQNKRRNSSLALHCPSSDGTTDLYLPFLRRRSPAATVACKGSRASPTPSKKAEANYFNSNQLPRHARLTTREALHPFCHLRTPERAFPCVFAGSSASEHVDSVDAEASATSLNRIALLGQEWRHD